MEEVLDRLTRLEERLKSHVDREDEDRRVLIDTINATRSEVVAIRDRLQRQGGFVAGVASAFSLLIGVIIWMANRMFGGN